MFVVCPGELKTFWAKELGGQVHSIRWFDDLSDALSDLLFEKTAQLIVVEERIESKSEITDLVRYLNKEVKVVFVSNQFCSFVNLAL